MNKDDTIKVEQVDNEGNDVPAAVLLDDDEAFLAGDDTVIAEKDALKLFQQTDNVISYEIVNFYNEKGKPRNRMALRNDPPILQINSSNGESVDFVITQNFAKSLNALTKDIDRAYSGLSTETKKEKRTANENVQAFVKWMKSNPFKTGFVAVFVLFMVVMSVINF